MANEPERKIEELLRAYAQKRREQAGDGFELHPATRRMLQAEVARQWPQKSESDAWGFLLSRIWLRAGLAVSLVVVLGLAFWWLQPWGSLDEKLMAKIDRPAAPAVNAPEVSRAAPAKALAQKSEEALESKVASGSLKRSEAESKLAPANKPIASDDLALEQKQLRPPQTLAKSAAKSERRAGGRGGAFGGGIGGAENNSLAVAQDKAGSSSYFAFTTPAQTDALQKAPSTNMPADAMERSVQLRSFGAQVAGVASNVQQRLVFSEPANVFRQRFATVQNAELLGRPVASALAAPLSSFTLEQAGDRIRIIDSDGSVYEGQLLAATEQKLKEQASADQAKDVPARKVEETLSRARQMAVAITNSSEARADAPGALPITFRATGTNVTLKQVVVVQASVGLEAGSVLTPQQPTATTAPVPAFAPPAAPATPPPATLRFGGMALSESEPTKARGLVAGKAPGTNAVQLQGTAKIGNNPEMPIKALRVTP